MTTDQDPRWLTPEEQATWRALTSLLVRLPAALDAQLRRDAGITHFDYQVLSQLSEQPGRRLRLRELATLVDSSLQRLSQVVTRLETKGWVERVPDPADGRTTLAVLTDAGFEKVVATAPGHAAEVLDLAIDPLSPDQHRAMREIAERIVGTIEERR
ncbi:MarR family winged helix-turn-helix transcriptional regulator [Brachybacterium sp. GU-2]|uniref:MarR family winged helix-turn-helix transcriptional regulator n=1 Tax=Brachybacterium sp. GU-2 TaxID=3069708 RepID=UPI00280AE71E|nr:MarR family transcriptional regulator [Brachybacterium sp. GU-2]WME22813.1 MarR family transcriptional regulator [Brachybacterium sp. GU-2]